MIGQLLGRLGAMASRERPPSFLADKPLLSASIYVTVALSLSNMVHPKLIECRASILRKLLKDAEAERDKLKKQMEREKMSCAGRFEVLDPSSSHVMKTISLLINNEEIVSSYLTWTQAKELTHVCPSDTFGSGDGY